MLTIYCNPKLSVDREILLHKGHWYLILRFRCLSLTCRCTLLFRNLLQGLQMKPPSVFNILFSMKVWIPSSEIRGPDKIKWCHSKLKKSKNVYGKFKWWTDHTQAPCIPPHLILAGIWNQDTSENYSEYTTHCSKFRPLNSSEPWCLLRWIWKAFFDGDIVLQSGHWYLRLLLRWTSLTCRDMLVLINLLQGLQMWPPSVYSILFWMKALIPPSERKGTKPDIKL